jgi:hypothetical protein
MAKKNTTNKEVNSMLSTMFNYEITVTNVEKLPFDENKADRYIFASNEEVKVYQYFSQNFAVIGNDIYEF